MEKIEVLEEDQKMEKDLDFFLDNNASQKKKKYVTKKIKPYITTRIKARNFLTKISYNGVKEENLFDRNSVFDVYTLTTKTSIPALWREKYMTWKPET